MTRSGPLRYCSDAGGGWVGLTRRGAGGVRVAQRAGPAGAGMTVLRPPDWPLSTDMVRPVAREGSADCRLVTEPLRG